MIHIDIRNGKVWLQHDGTDARIAEQLIEAGILKHNIVLGFQEPTMCEHSGFAWHNPVEQKFNFSEEVELLCYRVAGYEQRTVGKRSG